MENAITDINIVERKLLANIKRRPGMYIGKMSLEFLQNFFNGYNCAANCISMMKNTIFCLRALTILLLSSCLVITRPY